MLPLAVVCRNPPLGQLASPLWAPLHRDLLSRVHPSVPTAPTNLSPDFLVISCDTTLSTTFAFLCISSQDMHAALVKTAPRIAQCIKQYGADRTNILILIQPGQASCLQALQYFLFTKVVPSVSTPIATIATQTRLSVAACRNDSSRVAMPVAMSAEGMPNIIACRSCKDAQDLITYLLDQPKNNVPQTILPPPPMTQAHRQQDSQTMSGTEEPNMERNPWSNWFYTATSTMTGSILSTKECDQLKRELCTIRTISLATSSQFRGNCQLRDPAARFLEGFFETDQPL